MSLKSRTKTTQIFFIKKFLCYIFVSFSLSICFFSKAESPIDFIFPTAEENNNIIIHQLGLAIHSQSGDIKDSVWKIQKDFHSSGTAFFIGPNFFVTNFHVLHEMLRNGDSLKQITLRQEGSSFYPTVNRVIAISVLHDLAILETKESVSSYLQIKGGNITPNEELSALGYPQGRFRQIKKTGQLFAEDSSYFFLANYSRLSGGSGSPLLNEKEQVIGVLSKTDSNFLTAYKSSHLQDLISGETGLYCFQFTNLETCIKQGLENLKSLAEQGLALAQLELGKMYFIGQGGMQQNKPLAFDLMQQAAEQGYLFAQYTLANMHLHGLGTSKDQTLASDWLKKLIEKGMVPAKYRLARILYDEGHGTEQNIRSAFELTKQAAEEGYIPAQLLLAVMYRIGDGIKPDRRSAFYWARQTEKQGSVRAQDLLFTMTLLNFVDSVKLNSK